MDPCKQLHTVSVNKMNPVLCNKYEFQLQLTLLATNLYKCVQICYKCIASYHPTPITDPKTVGTCQTILTNTRNTAMCMSKIPISIMSLVPFSLVLTVPILDCLPMAKNTKYWSPCVFLFPIMVQTSVSNLRHCTKIYMNNKVER
jgi:hypothetical protein